MAIKRAEIIPLGGCGEIGKNMCVVGIGDGLLVVDAGLSFPTEEMHGVDIVIPDFTYLKENLDRVRGIVLTHGHEDHVGALPYILQDVRVPVYGTELALALARRKVAQRLLPQQYEFVAINPGDRLKIGEFEVEAIHVTHSIPDSCAIAIHTDMGAILFTGDFKFDFTPIDGKLTDLSRFGELGDEGVLLLLCDSTNAELPGWGPSERVVNDGFRRVMGQAKGRVLITMFASNLHRVQQAFEVANEFGRKVALAGSSMEQNTAIGKALDKIKITEDIHIGLHEVDAYPEDRVTILTTGAQGEPLAALTLMAREEYSRMQIRPGDTVIYSAKPIPGNEAAVWQTVNRLFRQGAHVVYGPDEGVHASGHGYQEEIRMMINLTRPRLFAPVHGEPRHQYHCMLLAKEMGYHDDSIILFENGNRLVLQPDGAFFAGDVPCGRVLVDSSGLPGVSDELLRDRSNLASDGVVFINVAIDSDAGVVVGEPEILARGAMLPNGEIERLRQVISAAVRGLSHAELHDVPAIHQNVSDIARAHLKKATNKRPLVLASVIDV